MTREKLRSFEQERNEDATTYKWSYDGNFIAKKYFKGIPIEYAEGELEKNEELIKQIEEANDKLEDDKDKAEVPAALPTEDIKSYISVYEVTSTLVKIAKDNNDDRTSIHVDGLSDFLWAPHKNMIIHTSFPSGENVYP